MAHMILPSVNIFIVSGNKLLLSRRQNTGWLDGHLCAPGGHVEEGETPRQAIIREVSEELGAIILEKDLEFLCVAVRNTGTREYVAYEFTLHDEGYIFKNTEPDRCSELVWVDLQNLPDDVISDFRAIIERGLVGGEHYLELGY
jgi:8-oxo-dGTP pyrophosphatase MutT (NUDIX family)